MKPIAGSVSVAGALPGLQNRGDDSVSPNASSQLRKLPPSLAAQGKRAARNQARLDAPNDTELAAVVDAWPELPEAIRAGILAMVRAASGRD
jgi:hypothetical protein